MHFGFSLEDELNGMQSVQINPIIRHDLHFEHSKFDVAVFIRFGDHYLKLVQGSIKVAECKDVISMDYTVPPLILKDQSETSLNGPTIILHNSHASAHYLNNVAFKFKTNAEWHGGNFDKSSVEKCLSPEALNAIEIHCQVSKVPSIELLFDQDLPEEEAIFSVGQDDLAFKMSSCNLASSTEEMMKVKRRRLGAKTLTPEKPCNIMPTF